MGAFVGEKNTDFKFYFSMSEIKSYKLLIS